MKGFFLVVEGPEGAGKSTLVRALEGRLRTTGREVVMVHEPGTTTLAQRARQLVLDPGNEVSPPAELFLMLVARTDLVEKEIRPQLARGAVVVSDRFDLSTLAYQVAGRGLAREGVVAANAFATGGLIPDLTLVLDIPREIGAARQAAAGKTLDRLERESAEFYRRVHAAYLAATGPGVVHIDATRDPAIVADAAWAALSARLKA